jgi:VanZ family protein
LLNLPAKIPQFSTSSIPQSSHLLRSSQSVLRAWLPAALWLVVIAVESSSLLASSETSRFLLPLLRSIFPDASRSDLLYLHAFIRKLGHFSGYAVLSVLLFRGWWATMIVRASGVRPRTSAAQMWGTKRLPSWRAMLPAWSARAMWLAMLGTALAAALDEWHQSLYAARSGRLTDVLLDSAGGWFALMMLLAASRGQIRALVPAHEARGRRIPTPSSKSAESVATPAESNSGTSAP